MMLGACRFFISIQFMGFVEILLLALSLSADSFVVSMGGSVSLGKVRPLKVLQVALVFGIVQSACLFAGWISGYSIVAYISRVANYIALAVLGYLGVSMFVAGVRNSSETVDLGGMKSLCVAAVATSVDAIAVGVSLAMGDTGFADAFDIRECREDCRRPCPDFYRPQAVLLIKICRESKKRLILQTFEERRLRGL